MTKDHVALAQPVPAHHVMRTDHERSTRIQRPWIHICLFTVLCFACAKPHPTDHTTFILEGETIASLQQKMADGTYTAAALTQFYLDRIHDLNEKGPNLHAVIELNPDAMSIAYELDIERMQQKIRGPLHGIPILIKDNIETGDRMQTTAGSLALSGNRAKQDAFLIAKLREAGAIILGKTNMSEWANYRSSESRSGWSSRGGQTKNPYVLDAIPCGSSSGSAVAVAADMCAVAVGTSTNGSIECPSSYNGIVGIRPTTGLISRSGLIPLARSQDTPGPMARTVRDAAILLGIMCGYDPADDATHSSKNSITDYEAHLHPKALQHKIIGIEKGMLADQSKTGKLLQAAVEQLRNGGATIVEVEFMNKHHSFIESQRQLLAYEFKNGINQYLSSAQGQVQSLDDVIAYNKRYEHMMMPYFKQDLLERATQYEDIDTDGYREVKCALLNLQVYLEALMDLHNLDAIAGVGFAAYSPAAIAGWPSITVPMGEDEGVPVGLTFFSKAYQEPILLAIAYAYEQLSRHRKSPGFLLSPNGS